MNSNKSNPYLFPSDESQHRVQTVKSKNHKHLAASFYKRFHINSQTNQRKNTVLNSFNQLPLLLDTQPSTNNLDFTSPQRKPPKQQYINQKPRFTQNTSHDKDPYTLLSKSLIPSTRCSKARAKPGDLSAPEINNKKRISPLKEDNSPSSIQLSSLKGSYQANINKSRKFLNIGTLNPECNYTTENNRSRQKVLLQCQEPVLSPYQRIKGSEGSQPRLFIQRNNTGDSAFRSRFTALLPKVQQSGRSFHHNFTETKRKQIIDSIVRSNRNCPRPRNP